MKIDRRLTAYLRQRFEAGLWPEDSIQGQFIVDSCTGRILACASSYDEAVRIKSVAHERASRYIR